MIVKRLFGKYFERKHQCNVFDFNILPKPLWHKTKGISLWFCLCLLWICGCQGTTDVPQALPVPSSFSVESDSIRPFLDPPHTLAILPFVLVNGRPGLHWLERSLPDLLMSDLARWPEVEVVSRGALGAVLREQWLQHRGFSSPVNPVNLGQVKGAHYLIQGKIYHKDTALILDVQIINVETGVIVGSMRTEGSEANVPELAQDLVRQTIQLFGLSTASIDRVNQHEEQYLRSRGVDEKGVSHDLDDKVSMSDGVNPQTFLQMEAALSLEKRTRKRLLAMDLAQAFWQEGIAFELGQPSHGSLRLPSSSLFNVPFMTLPVSVFVQQNRLGTILEKLTDLEGEATIQIEHEGLVAEKTDSSGASQLFIENFAKPRRMFVRALTELGEVAAVFSDWSWRTDANIDLQSPKHMTVPFWPQPFLTGMAQFPLSWINGQGQHVTFDVVVVPIYEEYIGVVLEPVEEWSQEGQSHTEKPDGSIISLKALEGWVHSHWSPPITEGFPSMGYLPGNKRSAVFLLKVEEGKIAQVDLRETSNEPFFVQSLVDLKKLLLGYCLICDTVNVTSPAMVPTTIRLQLTMQKDIQAVELGTHVR